MPTTLLSCIVCVMAVTSIARGAEPVAIESPEIAKVRVVNNQYIELHRTIERDVIRTVTDGQAFPGTTTRGTIKPATRTETVTVIEQQITRLAIDRVAAWRVGGEKVPAETLAAELREPTAVIVLRADQRLDAACAKLFKPDVLVVQLSAGGAPPTTVPGQPAPRVVYPPQPLAPR